MNCYYDSIVMRNLFSWFLFETVPKLITIAGEFLLVFFFFFLHFHKSFWVATGKMEIIWYDFSIQTYV